MATPTRPRNRDRILHKIIANVLAATEVSSGAGHAGTIGYLKSKLWVSAGAPSGTAPDGMNAKDLILDTTNNEVYRYISGTTYVKITARYYVC